MSYENLWREEAKLSISRMETIHKLTATLIFSIFTIAMLSIIAIVAIWTSGAVGTLALKFGFTVSFSLILLGIIVLAVWALEPTKS